MNVSLIDNGRVIDKIILNGKIKGNYFSIDKNLTFVPLFPIYYIHNENKTIIGTDENGNLIVVNGYIREGHILVMGAGYRSITSRVYKRLIEQN
ncbi:hypothetical protein [Seonamhaeicola sp. ML3]|uniref:hypothetical protein n=1 Tax=Seonamhaeicola sp. ML3 TaxID=2937786 RepID=UPI00200D63C3|nr:hypothetical protein [Seonamhaeicola sp. ML3]